MWLIDDLKQCSLDRSPLYEQETSVTRTAEPLPSIFGIILPGVADVT